MCCNKMSYFVLSKSSKNQLNDNSDDNLICTNSENIYLLPRINYDYYEKNGLFESNLIEWCKQFGDISKIFLDIGSHTGTYGISLAPYFNHIYCFEPQKMTYYACCGSVALSKKDNMTCLNIGLGSQGQSGNMMLNINSIDGGGSSLHKINNVLRTEEVKIKTLDSLNIENVGFIKMDVENNELDVLKGATNTLLVNNYPKILFESNNYNQELFDYLKDVLEYNVIQVAGTHNMFLATK